MGRAININHPPEDTVQGQHIDSLFDLATAVDAVSEFVKSVCRRCFTISNVWGNRRNLNKFLSSVDRFVRLNKGETMCLSQLMEGMKVSAIIWKGKCQDDAGCHSSPELRIHYMVARLIYWIFTSFIIPLITNYFYATECEGQGGTVFYYRKPVWGYISSLGCHQFNKSFTQLVPNSSQLGNKRPRSRDASTYVEGDSVVGSSSYRGKGLSISEWLVFPNTNNTAASTFSSSVSDAVLTNSMKDISVIPNKSMNSNVIANGLPNSDKMGHPCIESKDRQPQSRLTATGESFNKNVSAGHKPRFPVVRFVPKKSSVRIITNMKVASHGNGRTSKGRVGQMAQSFTSEPFVSKTTGSSSAVCPSSLYNCLHVFRQIYIDQPHLIGFGVLGMDEIYLKLKLYRSKVSDITPTSSTTVPDCNDENDIPNNSQTDDVKGCEITGIMNGDKAPMINPTVNAVDNSGFYMAVLDLEKCYDNVDTMQLFDIMKNVMHSYTYHGGNDKGFVAASRNNNESNGHPDVLGDRTSNKFNSFPIVKSLSDVFNKHRVKRHTTIPGISKVANSTGGLLRSFSDTTSDRRGKGLSDSSRDSEFMIHKYGVSHYMSSMERVVTKNIRYVSSIDNFVTSRGNRRDH